MDKVKKLEMIEELLDCEEGTLQVDSSLAKIEEWDSIAHLSLIIMLEEDFGKKVSGKEIRALETVDDILAIMG